MAVGNRFDSLYPDKQTRPSTTQVGGTGTKDIWDELNATAISGATLGAGTSLYIGGAAVARIYTETVDFVGGTAKTVTHSLNNSNPIVQVYGSGTNQQLPFGSGTVNQALPAPQSIIVSVSGSSANAVSITVTSGVAGAKVVVFG